MGRVYAFIVSQGKAHSQNHHPINRSSTTMNFKGINAMKFGPATGSAQQANNISRGGAIFRKIPQNALFGIPSCIQTFAQSPYTKKKMLLLLFLGCFILGSTLFLFFYAFHRGFRRTVHFWKGTAPFIIEYKLLKFKAKHIDKIDIENEESPSHHEYTRRIKEFHLRTAPKAVKLILDLGGIYVKLGQFMSTAGSGILDESYTKALQPLQDGVPPRDYEEISSIIEKSTGKRMEDIFIQFDESPVGSASIAQAHRAILRPTPSKTNINENVIVKVQYPEVAELFNADLGNLELFTKLFDQDNMELVKSLRRRHENELDFRIEADNLREISGNMQRHGLEPSIVRIPRVRNETGICSQHVLVMEYLDGVSLKDAITEEQNRYAKALGKKDADELQASLAKRMRQHFERGGGDSDETLGMISDDTKLKLLKMFGPFAASAFRLYANAKDRIEDIIAGLSPNGGMDSPIISGRTSQKLKYRGKKTKFNLAKALKTLVHVHGLQLLKDGVYNLDPHPGNCLILPDGRLGLLDYGMVGRLPKEDREKIVDVIIALSKKDKKKVAQIYENGGYKITMRDTGDPIDTNVLHRFAMTHFDKFDVTKITLENGEKKDFMEVLQNIRINTIPVWVDQGRRLTRLLMGVSAQAARPISLAKEWEPIASQALREKI